LGATLNVGHEYALALSLAHTERAPSVRELYARGNNLATNSYELGLVAEVEGFENRGVSAEDILESTDAVNLTFRKTGGALGFEIGLFYQDVSDYVFARLIETENETGVPHNFLVYTAADARFAGIDGQVSYQLTPASRVTVFGDYVDAKLKSENDNLPRIPPGRLGARYEHAAGSLSGDVEYYHTFEQDKIALYETRTAGYDMLNATLSYRFDLGRAKAVELYVRGTNLLNELAFVHTSFVKDQSPLRGRNFVIGMRHAF
jgi:iron complex outermembrane receptor protein